MGLQTCIYTRHDKFIILGLNTIKEQSDEKVHKKKNLEKMDDYVNDIETETHGLNCGFPLIVHNTDSFVLSMRTESFIKDSKNSEDMTDFSSLDEKHELFSNKNKQKSN